jgi:hypothetical protein
MKKAESVQRTSRGSGASFGAGVAMAAVTMLLSAAGVEMVLNVAISAIVYLSILLIFKEPLLKEIKNIMGFGAVKM